MFKFLRSYTAFFLLCIFSSVSAAPLITSISPASGPAVGGTVITINGLDFSEATSVVFGEGINATSFIINSDTSITAVTPAFAPGNQNITVSTLTDSSVASALSNFTYLGDWNAVFTLGNNTVSVVSIPDNTATPVTLNNAIASTITLDGRFAYVVTSAPDVSVVDLVTNTIVATIPITAGSSSYGIAINASGTTVYVVSGNALGSTIIPIDVATNVAGTTVPVTIGFVSHIALSVDGSTAFVVSPGAAGLAIDLQSITQTPLGIPIPLSVKVSPDGTTAYVLDANGITPLDLPSLTSGTPIPFVGYLSFAITPDGSTAVAASTSEVVVVDLNNGTVSPAITLGFNLTDVAITPDGLFAYVSSQTNAGFFVVDIAAQTASSLFPLPDDALSVAITPDQAPFAFYTFTAPNQFDASASLSPTGTIVDYEWDFGNGVVIHTTTPSLTQSVSAGQVVTLTVTNSAGTSTSIVFTGQTASNNGNASFATFSAVNGTFFGQQVKNKFINDYEYVNELSWLRVNDPTILGFRLYRNGVLVYSTLQSGSLHYVDFNQSSLIPVTYTLVTVNNVGVESNPQVITLP